MSILILIVGIVLSIHISILTFRHWRNDKDMLVSSFRKEATGFKGQLKKWALLVWRVLTVVAKVTFVVLVIVEIVSKIISLFR